MREWMDVFASFRMTESGCGLDLGTPISHGGARRGFPMIELMVAAVLGSLVLAGVLTTNLQLARSGTRVTQYAEMSTQARRAVEQLEGDLKSAINITWNGASDITLTLPAQNGTTSQVTYAWTSATQSFFRVPGASSAVLVGRIYLVNGIPLRSDGSAGLIFSRYDRDGNVATTDLATKKVQVSLNVVRTESHGRDHHRHGGVGHFHPAKQAHHLMPPRPPVPSAARRIAGERGSMLLAAMLFATGMALVLGTYLTLSRTSLKVAHRTFFANDAANLAEAGVEEALYCFNLMSAGTVPATAWTGWTISAANAMKTLPSFNRDQNAHSASPRSTSRATTAAMPRPISSRRRS